MSKVRTCLNCYNDNGADAKRCNKCGIELRIDGTDFLDRWICSKCGRINMKDNSKCFCGEIKPDCFLTTITCELLGKNDNCYELDTLRKFRTNYLKLTRNGQRLLESYRIYSDFLVPNLKTDEERIEIAKVIFNKYIKPTSELIVKGDNEAATIKYKQMVFYLLKKYNYQQEDLN